MNEEIIQSFLQVLPRLKDIIQEDVMTSVTDKTKFLGYFPGDKMRMDLKVGTLIPESDPLFITINENKIISAVVPKQVYGFPFKAVTYPICNEAGEVIGAVGFAKNLDNEFELQEASESLFSSLEETNASIEEISGESLELFSRVNKIVELTKKSEESLLKINELTSSIQQISTQSNLLGLNAAIESSRAGEQGKGFSVVASEMRKLAITSKKFSDEISKLIMELKKEFSNISEEVNNVNSISKSQSEVMGEITVALQELTYNAQILSNTSRMS